MKSLVQLARETLIDISVWCHVSTTRDYETITSRIEHEGLSFLTIVLPAFGADFTSALDKGFVDPSMFCGFSKHRALPRFLGGLLDLVFDRNSGRLLDDPSIDAITGIRQICLMFSKVLLPCSDVRVKKAFDKYIECESIVKLSDRQFPKFRKEFESMSLRLWGNLLSSVDKYMFDQLLLPKHGPGATADKNVGNSKYSSLDWTDRLEKEFSASEYLFANYRSFLDNAEKVNYREPGAEIPVKVITVPKTLKTPRIIAVEPTCMQYTQQAILRLLVDEIEKDDISFNFISFLSQTPNQVLAKEGSITGALATLDLSEASDRVSNQHVRSLLRHHGTLFRGVDACRSRKADIPGYGVKRLSKFASMGSALCFPFEAMVFTTIVFLGIEHSLNRRLTKKDIKSFFGKVRVYGDDIIIPVEHVNSVVSLLNAFGLKVNDHKSFWTGKFRESCGKDYYDGHDVSIFRVRQLVPQQRGDSKEIISTVSLRNQAYSAGYWRLAGHLDTTLGRLIPFPNGEVTSPGLVRHSSLGYSPEKMCEKLHRPLVKAMVVSPRPRRSNLQDYGALTKCLSHNGLEPLELRHLEFAGRPTAVDIKRRWTSPF